MTTSCSTCHAAIVQRVYLSVPGCGEVLPLFAETYRCGAVQLCGLILGDGVARRCPISEEERRIAESRTLFSCRCCERTVGGWTDGAVKEPGWYSIKGIDGPDAICPSCVADGSVAAFHDEYERARVGAPRVFRPESR